MKSHFSSYKKHMRNSKFIVRDFRESKRRQPQSLKTLKLFKTQTTTINPKVPETVDKTPKIERKTEFFLFFD